MISSGIPSTEKQKLRAEITSLEVIKTFEVCKGIFYNSQQLEGTIYFCASGNPFAILSKAYKALLFCCELLMVWHGAHE